jgi:hypothetical protein
MTDIFNGYFPLEFKDDYPEGIIFNLSGSSFNFYTRICNIFMRYNNDEKNDHFC